MTSTPETGTATAEERKTPKKARTGARGANVAPAKAKSAKKAKATKKTPKAAKEAGAAKDGSKTAKIIDLLKRPAHQRIRFGIGYMPEDRRLVPEFTVEENIRLPLWTHAIEKPEERFAWIAKVMPEVERFHSRRALELSGGQQKMVALARALMAGTRILLLDEPFEGLAPALARRLGEVLADLRAHGVSILIAESNESHIRDLLTRSYAIERGTIKAH